MMTIDRREAANDGTAGSAEPAPALKPGPYVDCLTPLLEEAARRQGGASSGTVGSPHAAPREGPPGRPTRHAVGAIIRTALVVAGVVAVLGVLLRLLAP